MALGGNSTSEAQEKGENTLSSKTRNLNQDTLQHSMIGAAPKVGLLSHCCCHMGAAQPEEEMGISVSEIESISTAGGSNQSSSGAKAHLIMFRARYSSSSTAIGAATVPRS